MNWTIVKDFASEHRTWIIWIVVVLAALGGGFAAGTYLKPAKVVEKEKITYQEKIVYQDKIVEKIVEHTVYVKAQQTDVQRTVVEVVRPDGTVERNTTERDLSHSNTSKENDKQTVKVEIKYVDREVIKEVEKTKIVEAARPGWRVGAGVGYDVMTALDEPTRGIPGLQGFSVSLSAERRVIGPFWMGAWGTTTGLVGVQLSGEF